MLFAGIHIYSQRVLRLGLNRGVCKGGNKIRPWSHIRSPAEPVRIQVGAWLDSPSGAVEGWGVAEAGQGKGTRSQGLGGTAITRSCLRARGSRKGPPPQVIGIEFWNLKVWGKLWRGQLRVAVVSYCKEGPAPLPAAWGGEANGPGAHGAGVGVHWGCS